MTEHKVKPVRYMDFVGTRRAASTDPLISRPVAKRPPVKPAAKPADRSSVKVEKTAEKPMISRKPATSRDLYPTKSSAVKPAEKSAEKPAAKPASKKSDTPDNNSYSLGGKSPFLPNVSVEKRGLSDSVPDKKPEHFEKVSYLGVNDSSEKSRKNVYDKKEIIDLEPESKKKHKEKKPVKIIDNKEKKSGFPLALIIILTIILGAAVGAGVYFLLPK